MISLCLNSEKTERGRPKARSNEESKGIVDSFDGSVDSSVDKVPLDSFDVPWMVPLVSSVEYFRCVIRQCKFIPSRSNLFHSSSLVSYTPSLLPLNLIYKYLIALERTSTNKCLEIFTTRVIITEWGKR